MACNSLLGGRSMLSAVRAHPPWRLLLALGVGLGALARAEATTFVRMDEHDLAARATAAVIGLVTAVRVESAGADAPIYTVATIAPEQVVFGDLPAGPLSVREPGGRIGGRAERIFGSAEYRAGERVLAFLSRGAGAWHTTAMAMGKYRVASGTGGARIATRDLGDEVAVLDPATGALQAGSAVEKKDLNELLGRVARVRAKAKTAAAVVHSAPSPPSRIGHRGTAGSLAAPFTYLGTPSRWFEADDDIAVQFLIDPAGASGLTAEESTAAAVQALAAWTDVAGTSLVLTDGVLDEPLPFDGCGGANRVVFDDQFNEIEAPVDCRGVLGIGGFCYADEQRTVNGTRFNRIRVGKVVMADGFSACDFWTRCNLAQVLTHELGHAIGLGHSPDTDATMLATARFDGRCAGLGADDIAAVRFIYPRGTSPTPTQTPTFTPPPPPITATRTRTPTMPTATPTEPRPGFSAVSGRLRYFSNDQPVAGVSVDLEGESTRRATSNASGGYGFLDVPNGEWSVRPRKLGDAGLGISALDAALILQASAGLRSLDPVQAVACDVTGNGSVSPLDAARILQRVVGLLPRFATAETCGSDWLFVPAAAGAANQVAFSPELGADTCRPGALIFTPLDSIVASQDFRAALIGDCTGNWQPGGEARGAEPDLAPEGTALELGPLRRVRGGRWRQPIGLRAPQPVHALDLELRYDSARLDLAEVRDVRLGNAALVNARVTQPGRVLIGLASATALPADGRAVLVVEFAARSNDISAHLVRPFSIAVDEKRVPR